MKLIEEYIDYRNKTKKEITYEEFLEMLVGELRSKMESIEKANKIYRDLRDSQKDIPNEFSDIINKEFWNLI